VTVRLHFHLGPVQGFIAEARRTRDVWAGSFLLSWLIAKAMVAAMSAASARIEDIDPDVSQDPMFAAVHDRAGHPDRAAAEPCLGTLTNHFSIAVDPRTAAEAGTAASAVVRKAWTELATAVRMEMFETDKGKELATKSAVDLMRPFAIWNAQIGGAEHAPLWDVSWVVAPDDDSAWLDARKRTHWFGGAANLPTEGNFCSMMSGWAEISGFTRHKHGDDQKRFWSFVRQRAVEIRHPGIELGADACLDIRPGEVLCAPALVKRLFPLLPEATLGSTIGWVPYVRADDAFSAAREAAKSDRGFAAKLRIWFIRTLTSKQQREPVPETAARSPTPAAPSREQHILLWPSTSAVAAAHWIARANRHARDDAQNIVQAIEKLGCQYRRAESSLWLQCHQEGIAASDLSEVDGALLFEPSVQRIEREFSERLDDARRTRERQEIERLTKRVEGAQELRNLLDRLAKTVFDPGTGAKIGRPSPCYALLRADGDKMGELLAAKRRSAGAALNRFALEMRGGSSAASELGVIAGNNGVTLYAGADEMLAMFPVDNALEAARAIREAFLTAFKDNGLTATISIAITFAHRQVPLRWVLTGNRELLALGKKIGGRNALALEIRDAGGRICDWVAPWEAGQWRPPVDALERLVAGATGGQAGLGANQFLHDLAEALRPFALEDETLAYAERLKNCREAKHVHQAELQKLLIAHCLASSKLDPSLADHIASTGWTFGPGDPHSVTPEILGFEHYWTPSGMRIVRFLAENWRRDKARAP